jgi:hypothetical protein
VPAYAGTHAILGHEDLLKLPGCHAGESRGDVTQRKQKRWDVLCFAEHSVIEVVLPPVGNYPPLPNVSLKLEVLKG